LFGAATIPGYWQLASRRRAGLLAAAAIAAAVTAVLVFAAAARDPRPEPVARAAVGGYALFALLVVGLAARTWFDEPLGRLGLFVRSFVPAVWAATATLLACSSGPGDTVRAALVRSGVVVVAYAPALWFARGLRATGGER